MLLAVMALHPLDMLAIVVYFAAIVALGVWVGRFTTTTQDFFFGGQRFSWWVVAVSCVATLVGSYSFVQYSESSFKFGFALLLPYTNEWFILPLFLGAWLPIVYFNRLQSIPEYFERRFDRRTRIAVLVVMLVYLLVYIGINLIAIGSVVEGVFGWEWKQTVAGFQVNWAVILSAALVALLSGIYLHAGGQTSVLVTDLFQGLLLLLVGLGVVAAAVWHVGGFERFFGGLPAGHRQPFAPFNHPPEYPAVGDFWNDAVVGTFAFYIINQGVLMRFLCARSVADGRKAMLVVVVILMPLAAVAVSGVGLAGRAMMTHGIEPMADVEGNLDGLADQPERRDEYAKQVARNVFVDVSRAVCGPGFFGLVIAAVIAALMSTLDTYIAAVAAIAVNDIWREVLPGRPDAYYLGRARLTAILVAVVGLGLIPIFDQFDTIYQALSAFTSAILPPLIVVITLGMVWPRFSARAAFWTILLGTAAVIASAWWPELIRPVSHGVDSSQNYVYLRGLFGLIVSAAIAGVMMLLEIRGPKAEVNTGGLVLSSIDVARSRYKGGVPSERGIGHAVVLPLTVDDSIRDDQVHLSREAMRALDAAPGDLVHVADARWWLGGFRSLHLKVAHPHDGDTARLGGVSQQRGHLLSDRPVRIEKII